MEKVHMYRIMNARVEVIGDCFTNLVLGEVEFEKEGEKHFLYLLEVDGYPEFRLSSNNIWECFLNAEDHSDVMEDAFISSFDGVKLPCDYEELIPTLKAWRCADGLLLFLIALVRCPNEAVDEVLKLGIGKYSDMIEPPMKYVNAEEDD